MATRLFDLDSFVDDKLDLALVLLILTLERRLATGYKCRNNQQSNACSKSTIEALGKSIQI